jgi:acetoacetyl-CoA synthetase
MRAGVEPGADFHLGELRMVASTAAPLSPEAFAWVYRHVKADLHLGSISGGTDLCGCLAAPCPLLPVRAGEIQCRPLGCLVQCYDEEGRPVVDQVGELVVTRPLPSMPLFLWNDDGRRYRESYFEAFPGVWRHGDLIKITPRGSVVIYGRSDSTLKRGGVRVGTSELYRIVEGLPGVADSIVVDTGGSGRIARLLLFVVPADGSELDEELERRIVEAIRDDLSPRHVPDEIHAIDAVPRTLNGKKLEVPVKRILTGTPLGDAVSVDAVANPESLELFVALAARGRPI